MYYLVPQKPHEPITCKCPTGLRLHEAFYKGMGIDYIVVTQQGAAKKVTFKPLDMTLLEDIESKITALHKQIAAGEKTPSLAAYYSNKLRSYTNRKNNIINNIQVVFEEVSATPLIVSKKTTPSQDTAALVEDFKSLWNGINSSKK